MGTIRGSGCVRLEPFERNPRTRALAVTTAIFPLALLVAFPHLDLMSDLAERLNVTFDGRYTIEREDGGLSMQRLARSGGSR